MKIVYRYDDEDYVEGETILSRGDSFDILTAAEQDAELVIRSAFEMGVEIRSTSLYTWTNEDLAKRLWKLSNKKNIYLLKVDPVNIRHTGDLNWYSLLVSIIQLSAVPGFERGTQPADVATGYWSGKPAGGSFTEPRMEALVSEAKVIRKIND